MSELSIRILELVSEHGQASVSGIMRGADWPRGTERLCELLNAGHLRAVGKGRAAHCIFY